jgi:putative endonuclease
VRFLEERGVTVVARNLRRGSDEIDLVVVDRGRRVIVEVKTAVRSSGFDPAENVDRRKADALRRAGAWLGVGRIDLVTVVIDDRGADVRWTPAVA